MFILKKIVCAGLCLLALHAVAQNAVKDIERITTPATALAPLHFLASDELMGRDAFRNEIHTAARYISEYFRSIGLKEVEGTKDYFQTFDIRFIQPGKATGSFTFNNNSFVLGKDMGQTRNVFGKDFSTEAPLAYIKSGRGEDFAAADVKGKIAVMEMITGAGKTVNEELGTINSRIKTAKEKGAVAVIIRYDPAINAAWEQLMRNFTNEYMYQEPPVVFPVYYVNDPQKTLVSAGGNAAIKVSGNTIKTYPAKNVMGYIEGTDKKLKEEFILLSAHYDGVGVTAPKMEEGKTDSIRNGARDNAIGTAAVMNAASYFAAHPPKRSVLFIAWTAEEYGLLGSKHFAANPAVPLKSIVYNLNIDNASYNDTTRVTVVGLGRTSADEDIKKGAAAFGLKAMQDPNPEQNFFDRSDNVSLAAKGIPAPTYSLGMKEFDEEIMKRYHQLSDEVGNMNLSYALKYIRSFIMAAKNIADNPVQPTWKAGDKYEAAWKTLYSKSF